MNEEKRSEEYKLTDLLCVECSQLSGMTRNKANFLLEQNKALVGVIVMDINSGDRAYIEAGAVRWMSIKDSYKLMHPNAPDCDCDLHT